ncbi:folylpolyglutamate synthase/dihydrofolate synthase family protein [soil metagenome]
MGTDVADTRYRAAVEDLQRRGRFGIRLGLGRTRALLRRLGNPERRLRGVLIGGTNGKGSVQALVAAVLGSQRQLVGQMPKPHLVEYRERIVIGGRPLAKEEFAAVVEQALDAAAVVEARHGPPTEFEVLTAAAFLAFGRASIDLLVAEVGMGGRLDATNTWQGGVSAITNVALDHTEYLGPTTSDIAREKAQIIKRGDFVALTGADGDALRVISARARRAGVPLRVVEPLPVLGMDRRGLRVTGPAGDELRVGLLGAHQAANAALALAIVDALAEAGIAPPPDPDALRSGLAEVRWPGRLELLDGLGTDVLLDGAHNPHGAAALAAALDDLRPHLAPGRAVLMIGVLGDKDVAGMLEPLRASAALRDARVIATTVPDSPRSLGAADLAARWGEGAIAIDEPDAALEEALAVARRDAGPLVVCGSLYLVGHVRKLLLPTDSDA